ncbi:Succinyl-CoA ligase [ADP-forming] subunit alpha, mitochondrial [Mycena sanguinolenta]|uniref:Succinyl-CoA ligase [ADP-forming] subunit alpha, mitochondrial n=1 Tax=Mycena sanguinolenta TaxID=230812 RepID=A0A8H6XYE2_9AGAR|nr:Succinyl-CoA ligase [ADP-forming] subunit alpha, mitochondrial [Mycena sanguinolenta]
MIQTSRSIATLRRSSGSACLLRRVSFSTSSARLSYEDTVGNLKIGTHTRVIFQGFTGRQATANAQESLAWGTNIVGGVTPGRDGMHPVLKELPVFPTVRAAVEQLKPDATGIYVAAHQAAAAIEEAIEAEIPLIVAVAEHIPVHQMLKIHSMLKSQSKCRLVGANAPGIISAIGRCRIGFQPLPAFTPGHVGIVAKSGTLSYETVASLTRAGLGQSLCIGMGGDIVAGTDFVDALSVFEHDAQTYGIIIVGEVGGRAEEEAAEWITEYRKRASQPKPIAALVAGKVVKPDYVMGHSGAWAGRGEKSAEQKYQLLQDAGAVMVSHPAKFGEVMLGLLATSTKDRKNGPAALPSIQRRHYHMSRPRPGSQISQRRTLHFQAGQAADLLSRHGISTTRDATAEEIPQVVSVTIDRSGRSPCFLVCPTLDTDPKSIPFDFRDGPTAEAIAKVLEHLRIDRTASIALSAAQHLLSVLHKIFMEYEGVAIEVQIAIAADTGDLLVFAPQFTFDDAAFKSCGRHPKLHALRDVSPSVIDPMELAAEADGIVYVKLGPQDTNDPEFQSYNIGTLVNGAGLAMNTVDALLLPPHHARATNFLDTGGKATSETVKKSFALLLADERVKVIFVNIFGGLTLGDMIARGILLAFQELGLEERGMPVVVRIRGTNEAEGQRILAESGLKIFAFDGFEEAAAKCVELARG